MKKQLTAVLLSALVLIGLTNIAMGTAATVAGNAILLAANGDSYTPGSTGAVIESGGFHPSASGKVYRLRLGSTTGNVVYQTTSSATTRVAISDKIFVPSNVPLYLVTDDTNVSFQGVSLYAKPPNK